MNSYGVSVLGIKSVLELDSGDGYMLLCVYIMPLTWMFKNAQDGNILYYVYSTTIKMGEMHTKNVFTNVQHYL